MGLGNAPEQVNLQDVFPAGSAFIVKNAWVEGQVDTRYGKRTMAKVVVTPVDDPDADGIEVAVWGSLAQQVQQVEPGDIPAIYQLTQDGNRWLFSFVGGFEAIAALPSSVPAEPPAEQPPSAEQRAIPEAHLDPAAAADPPTPAPPATAPGPPPDPAAAVDQPTPVPPAAPAGDPPAADLPPF